MIPLLNRYFYTIAIPPILPITISFIIGIIIHIPNYLLLIITISFLLYAHIKQIDLQSVINTIMLIIACAFGSFLLHKNITDHKELQTFLEKSPITLQGTIINKNKHEKKWTILEVAIDTIQKENEIKTSNKSALLYCEQDADICVGDVCTFLNITSSSPHNDNFTYYLIKEQIAFISFNKTITYTNLIRPQWSLRRFIHEQKTRLLTSLQSKLSSKTFRFFSSLFLGNRLCVKDSLEATNEQFKIWGISHFLARSGLHLALFLFIWHTFFSYVPLSFTIKQLVLLMLSTIYFVLTWTSAPFTRAFSLFLFHKLFLFLKRPFNLLHALTCVCLFFLLYCPLYLFFLDFQLSFSLTFALAWFNQLSHAKNR